MTYASQDLEIVEVTIFKSVDQINEHRIIIMFEINYRPQAKNLAHL